MAAYEEREGLQRLLLLASVLAASQVANAGKITLQLTSQEKTENGKTLCRYENSIYEKMITISGKHCPSVKSFDTKLSGKS